MDEREDYFDYVINVLGIKSVFMQPEIAKTKIPLLLAVENHKTFNAAEKELLEKMISSLKLDLNLIKVFDLADVGDFEFGYKISFLNAPKSVLADNQMQVFSPRMLLKDASLKKQAWDDLQKVIKYFALPRP